MAAGVRTGGWAERERGKIRIEFFHLDEDDKGNVLRMRIGRGIKCGNKCGVPSGVDNTPGGICVGALPHIRTRLLVKHRTAVLLDWEV